jgi:uridine kinase
VLAVQLAARLDAEIATPHGAAVLSLDSYYRPLEHLSPPERARYNFDAPEAIDSELLLQDVRELNRGKTVQCPVYDFAAHTRTVQTIELAPRPFLVIEGLFALYWEELRSLCGTRIYLDLDEELSIERRIARDMRERGRSRESVIRQYRATVTPMARRYVYPARAHADLIVSGHHQAGSDEFARELEAILLHIRHGVGAGAPKT